MYKRVPYTLDGWRELAAVPITSAKGCITVLGGAYVLEGELAVREESGKPGSSQFRVEISFPDGTAKSCSLSLLDGPAHPEERRLEALIVAHQGNRLEGRVGFYIPHRGGLKKKQVGYLSIPGLVEVVVKNMAVVEIAYLCA